MAVNLPLPTASKSTESDATTLRIGSGEMRSSRSRRGGIEGGQASESALFSPPARTRAEELQRVQLLQGTKSLKKIGSRESPTPFKEFATTTAGSVTLADGPSSQVPSAHPANSLTNDLLRLLLSEIASMRSTLESLAQDRALLVEVQRSNKLLALMLTSGRRLEGYERPEEHSLLVDRIKEKARPAEVILKTI